MVFLLSYSISKGKVTQDMVNFILDEKDLQQPQINAIYVYAYKLKQRFFSPK